MKISSNMAATYTIANMNKANNSMSTVMKRLSSGLRITSPGDDPAGLAICNKLKTQLGGISQAGRNVMDGISMVQTAEGTLNEVSDMLTRMKELMTQAKNGTFSTADVENIQKEIDSLVDEINNIKNSTEFNKNSLLNLNEDMYVQIGANAGQQMNIDGKSINLYHTLKHLDNIKIDDADSIEKVNKAIEATTEIRGRLGAYQNRLEHTSNNLGVSNENMTSALSTIEDADMAEEMANFTQYNVLTQAGMSMLAQANQRPQQILQLLN